MFGRHLTHPPPNRSRPTSARHRMPAVSPGRVRQGSEGRTPPGVLFAQPHTAGRARAGSPLWALPLAHTRWRTPTGAHPVVITHQCTAMGAHPTGPHPLVHIPLVHIPLEHIHWCASHWCTPTGALPLEHTQWCAPSGYHPPMHSYGCTSHRCTPIGAHPLVHNPLVHTHWRTPTSAHRLVHIPLACTHRCTPTGAHPTHASPPPVHSWSPPVVPPVPWSLCDHHQGVQSAVLGTVVGDAQDLWVAQDGQGKGCGGSWGGTVIPSFGEPPRNTQCPGPSCELLEQPQRSSCDFTLACRAPSPNSDNAASPWGFSAV